MLFSLRWLFLLIMLNPQAHENVGTKIVTQHSSPGGVSEETLYIMGDRRRLELRHFVHSQNSNGSPEVGTEPSSVFIQRCDLGQSLHLQPNVKEFSASSYPPKPPTPQQENQLAVENSGRGEPQKPTLRIETTTVDTGERQEMFGHVARHVTTTVRQTPLDGAASQSSLSVTDGWYIDLDRNISCDPKASTGTKRAGLLSGYISVGAGGRQPMIIPEFIDNGERETGLPLSETKTFPMRTKFADGTSTTNDSQIKSEVIVLETTALDPALFEVPSEYKQVEQNQRRTEE